MRAARPTAWHRPGGPPAGLPEAKAAKNRIHFDLRAPGSVSGKVTRLERLGATVLDRHPGHVVMRDPEGNEFCVEPGPVDRS